MKKNLVIGLIVVLVLAVAGGMALANPWGGGPGYGRGMGGGMMGYGPGMGGGPGMGYGPGMGGGPGYHMGYGMGFGPGAGAFDQKFYDETTETRNKLQQKHLEISQLMAAETVDEAKVTTLQKEINELRNELSQKHLAAELEFRKNNPDAARAYGPRGGFGPGNCLR